MSAKEESWGNNYYFRAQLKDIYTGEDISKGESAKIDDKEYSFLGGLIKSPATEVVNNGIEAGTNFVNTIKGAVEGLNEIKENFQHNPVGTLITLGLDLVRAILGDLPQFIANMVQTATDHTFMNLKKMAKEI